MNVGIHFCMYFFTDWNFAEDTKINYGWSMIVMIATHFFVEILLLVLGLFNTLKLYAEKYWNRYMKWYDHYRGYDKDVVFPPKKKIKRKKVKRVPPPISAPAPPPRPPPLIFLPPSKPKPKPKQFNLMRHGPGLTVNKATNQE